jgi:4-amino-4-deoxy-L-arabinose transferase-like glycosyltransferase
VIYGWTGLLIVGATMTLCPALITYSHYLKEDATLGGMILLTIGAAGMTLATRQWWSRALAIVLLGAGCGLTCSSKYVGVMIVAPALVALLLARGWRWWSLPARLVPFCLAGCFVIGLVNYRAFESYYPFKLRPDAIEGMSRETEHGMTEHNGMAMDTPQAYFLRVANSEVMLHAKILGGAGLAYLLMRRRFSRWGVAVLLFLVTFGVVLSYCPITFGRYAVPITVTAYLACALAMAAAVGAIRSRGIRIAGLIVVLLCVLTLQGRAAMKINHMFLHDSRELLREWVAANLPVRARIVADRYAQLHNPGDPWRFPNQSNPPMPIMQQFSAADFGSLDQLRRSFDYVVVCKMTYERFQLPGFHGVGGSEGYVEQHRAFYRDLFASGEPVWQYVPDPVTNSNLSPEIRVYKLR